MYAMHLSIAEKYAYLEPRFQKAYAFLKDAQNLKHRAGAEVAIAGKDLVARFLEYDTEKADQKLFECHKRYADIQFIISGHEKIAFAPLSLLLTPINAYDEEKDVAFYADPDNFSWLHMREGDVAVFFPEDGHKPSCLDTTVAHVRKIVVKIAI